MRSMSAYLNVVHLDGEAACSAFLPLISESEEMPYRVGHATSPRTPLSSRRHFVLENVASHRSVAAPLRRRSRLLRLLGCKRSRDASAALPIVCGIAPSALMHALRA